ncbi:MAG: Hsp20/alpha crystallin family protein [Rhodospirillaceae bacterium]
MLWSDPFQELRRFQQDIDRAFGSWGDTRTREYPPINLWAGEDGVVVSAELPGVNPDAVQITIHKNSLTISGKRDDSEPSKDAKALRRELVSGSFSRTVTLPFNVDADKVNARSDAGVLLIHLPRPEADKPKRIRIVSA